MGEEATSSSVSTECGTCEECNEEKFEENKRERKGREGLGRVCEEEGACKVIEEEKENKFSSKTT